MQGKVYIGVDVGKNGAISIIFPDGTMDNIRFPMIGVSYDIPLMSDMFKDMGTMNCHMVIEDVMALQKPMQAGNWSLSRGKTILEVLCHVHKIPHTLVHSKTWQKEMWQGVKIQKKGKKTLTKETSLLACQRLFPDVDLRDPDRKTERAKKPHDGVVDAILMAEYCRRKFK